MKQEKINKIRNSIYNQLKEKGIVTVVDTFMDIGILNKEHYERWRRGEVPYLERVCQGSLNKLSDTVKEIYKYAKELNLGESYTFYKKYGKGKVKLRFSKSGQEQIERRYANSFLPPKATNKE